MPPKRSSRLRNPSAQAVAIAAEGEPPRRKSRRAAVQPTPDTLGPSSVISTDQTVPIPHAASGTPQPASLPPGVLDQLATRVADEVTRCLSPPEDTSSTSIPSAVSEAPLFSTSSAPASTVSVPGTSTAIPGLAGDIVEGSLSTTQRALSGEAQVPSELFSSQVFRLMLFIDLEQ